MDRSDIAKAIEHSGLIVLRLALDGKIVSLNQAAAELLDVDAVGRDMHDLVLPASHARFKEVLEQISNGSRKAELLQLAIHVHQGDVRLLFKLFLLDDQVTLVGQDLSPLEHNLLEEKKKQLMTLVSQELRSPLNGMVGLTMALCKSPTMSPAIKKQLGVLRSSAARILDMVTNIMELDASVISKRDVKVNISELAEEVLVMVRWAVDRANSPLLKQGVELRNSIDLERVPLVLGNVSKCIQLLYNLLTNACKFTVKGSVTISAKHLPETSELEICVVDTGCGISPDALPSIFKAFEHGRSCSKEFHSFQGAGLGLAVCAEIVEMHGGSIRAESKAGEGSSFIVTLPCLNEFGRMLSTSVEAASRQLQASGPGKELPGEAASDLSPTAAQKPASAPRKKRPKILHVDSDVEAQGAVRAALAERFEVVSSSGKSQDLKNEGSELDVILLDVLAPLQFCKEVFSLLRHERPPALLLCMDASIAPTGAAELLQKPFDCHALQKIEAALQDPPNGLEQSAYLMTAKASLMEKKANALQNAAVLDRDKPQVGQAERYPGPGDVRDLEIRQLKQELAKSKARDIQIARRLRKQCELNESIQDVQEQTSSLVQREPVLPLVEKVNLAEVAEHVIARVRASEAAPLKPGVEIRSLIGNVVPVVMGDQKRIEQMLFAILERSCLATMAGCVTLACRHSKTEPFLEVIVTDPGSNLEDPDVFRSDLEARRIALEHGGSLTLKRSESGNITLVRLRCLPGGKDFPEPEGSRALGKAKRKRPLILSVDDDEINQEVVRSSLGGIYDVVCCMDGNSTFEWLEEHREDLPDVILLDVQMPGMTGYEVCRGIREKYSQSLWELPITLLSAKAPSSSAALEGFNSGSTDFIAKPFDQELLKHKVALSVKMKDEVQHASSRLQQERSPQQTGLFQATQTLHSMSAQDQSLQQLKVRSSQVAKRLLLQCQSHQWEEALDSCMSGGAFEQRPRVPDRR